MVALNSDAQPSVGNRFHLPARSIEMPPINDKYKLFFFPMTADDLTQKTAVRLLIMFVFYKSVNTYLDVSINGPTIGSTQILTANNCRIFITINNATHSILSLR